MSQHAGYRPGLIELAAAYDQYSVLVTTAELVPPGPQILYVNSAFTRMTGYSIHEMLGRTPRILQGPKTDRAMLDRLKAALTAGEEFIARAINYKRDGTEFEMEWIISHLRDASGRTTHYVALQRDITGLERARQGLDRFDAELRLASRQLHSTMERLEAAERRLIQRERLAAMEQMAAGVAHDLGNALTPIAHLVDQLNELDGLPQAARQAIQGIGASVSHSRALLAGLNRFSPNSSLSPPADLVDLRRVVEQVLEIVAPDLQRQTAQYHQPVRVECDLADVPRVRASAVELTQVVVNLVTNAIDAMPGGGLITIGLTATPQSVELTVRDTGPGMPSKLLDHCFEPFVTTKQSGSGLGLSVCHAIVERHAGQIEVRNLQPPGGALFTIRLPLDSALQPPSPRSGATGDRLRVLYIDDDPMVRDVVAQSLRRAGYEVETAADGDAGLAMTHERTYHAVITDTWMTPTSGIDVAMMLHRSRPGLPVILVSGGRIDDDDLPDALRHCSRLMKPFGPDDLGVAIARVVSSSP